MDQAQQHEQARRDRDAPTVPSPAARPSPVPRRWLVPAALTASVILAAAALFYAFTVRTEVQTLRQIAQVLRSPDLLRVDLKGQAAAASNATARALWSQSGGLVFTADRLPSLPPGRVYQLWTITGTSAASAGVLSPDPNGAVAITRAVPAGAPRPDAFGVTIEPVGGSAAPTLPIVMLGTASQ